MHKFFVLVLVALVMSSFARGQNLSVMTYNLRYDNPNDGPNAWPNRKARVIALIKRENPDVMGVQEALHHQLEDLKGGLAHFEYVGVGRDDGQEQGEYSAIFYNKEKFQVIKSKTFWLSETPDVPGSKNWDAAITRVATWAILLEKATRDTLFIVNTHFDHIGKVARERSAQLIKEKIRVSAGTLPVLLTGDFNTEPTDTPYQIMTNGEIFAFQDAGKGNPTGTYCSFKVNREPCRRIDFIFYNATWKVQQYRVVNDHDGQYYPSDHLPVVAVLTRK